MSILFEAVSVLQTPPLTNYTSSSIHVPNLIKYMKSLRSSDPIGILTVDYLDSCVILVFLSAIFLCMLFL